MTAEVLVADLTTADGLGAVAERLTTDTKISALVNNAGRGWRGWIGDTPPEAIEAIVDLNVTAFTRLTVAAAKQFAQRGEGLIINICSASAFRQAVPSAVYGASKAALDTMSMALARVLAPEIRVVVVAPGMVHTGFVPGRTEEMMARAAMATPLKRAIEPEDVALAVISCVTHLRHTTGSIIAVDAGRHL